MSVFLSAMLILETCLGIGQRVTQPVLRFTVSEREGKGEGGREGEKGREGGRERGSKREILYMYHAFYLIVQF